MIGDRPPPLHWRALVAHAGSKTRELWRSQVLGAIIAAGGAFLIEWAVSGFSGGVWARQMTTTALYPTLAVLVWLAGSALWHFWRAPVRLARAVAEDYAKTQDERNKAVEERDAVLVSSHGGAADTVAWLDARVREVRALQSSLRNALIDAAPDVAIAQSVEASFWSMNDEVLRWLHVEAPGWVAYYQQEPRWFHPGLSRITHDQFKDLDRMFDYTADQLAHIGSALRDGRLSGEATVG